jgi:uncharacterized damage-inducible protein DinB
MYEHLYWANQRILDILQNSEDDNYEVKRIFSHILLSEHIWLTRIKNIDTSASPIWAEISMEECSELFKQNNKNYTELFSGLTHNNIDKIISYKNSTGKEFTTSVRDILTHVALHGHYHRGQINQRLRADGFEPVNTDFITFVR